MRSASIRRILETGGFQPPNFFMRLEIAEAPDLEAGDAGLTGWYEPARVFEGSFEGVHAFLALSAGKEPDESS